MPMVSGDGSFLPSPEQQRVIDYRDGHLQVIACAGSGKTEAISQRVAQLVLEGAAPSSIIAFTFTERAAASMKARIVKRVRQKMGPEALDRLSPMYVGTIHAYCMRMLQQYVPRYANYDVLDEHRLAGLMSRECRRLELGRLGEQHWAPIHKFLRNADVVENERIPQSRLAGTDFGDCYKRYHQMLQRYRFLTFGQLISAACEALEDGQIHAAVHDPLRHLIVDEYQDVNPAQERLVSLLAKPPVHLCVVGDDDQSIYQWRGSNVGNMLDFKERYKAESRSLSINRRSRPNIIAAANTFAKSIKPRLNKKMIEYRPAGGPEISCWAAPTEQDEAETIASTIKRLVKPELGYRYRDMAVLLRSVKTSSPPIVEVLREKGIPVRCAGRSGLFLLPEAQVLGRTYAWLVDREWKEGRYESETVAVELGALIDEFKGLFTMEPAELKKLRQYLAGWKDKVKDEDEAANLVRDYYGLLRLLGVQEWNLDEPLRAAKMGSLARFSELLADFEHVRRRARWVEEEDSKQFRGGQNRGQWYYRNLFNYIQYYAIDAYVDFEGEENFGYDAVDVLTIHQAKGLEWPVVFMPTLVEGRFPPNSAGREQEWLVPAKAFPTATRRRYEGGETDERRLFYVAMTRARDVAYLSYFQKRKRSFSPSPFLVEVANGKLPTLDKLPLPPKREAEQAGEADKPQLSFSELAVYEDCPLCYRLSNLLGFQPQLVAELGYGKAVHHVLRRLADHVREHEALPTKKALEQIFDEEFYLPFAHRIAFEKLREAANKLVGRYLSKYSGDLFRIWDTERPFELHLENGIVSGRADVIFDREAGHEGALALVDYKSSTDPSANDVYAFQLAIYAAAGQGEGLNVQAAYLHDLAAGDRVRVDVESTVKVQARERATSLVGRIVQGDFAASPEKRRCSQCDVRFVCRHGPGR